MKERNAKYLRQILHHLEKAIEIYDFEKRTGENHAEDLRNLLEDQIKGIYSLIQIFENNIKEIKKE